MRKRLTWLVRWHAGVTVTFRVRWCDPHLKLCHLWRPSPLAFVQLLPFTTSKHVFKIPVDRGGGEENLFVMWWLMHGWRSVNAAHSRWQQLLTSCTHPAGGCSSHQPMTAWRQLSWSWSCSTWMKPPRSALSAAEATGIRISKAGRRPRPPPSPRSHRCSFLAAPPCKNRGSATAVSM